jgi:hypothetical protein
MPGVFTLPLTFVPRAPAAGAAATVVMFHPNEPGARDAFDRATDTQTVPMKRKRAAPARLVTAGAQLLNIGMPI